MLTQRSSARRGALLLAALLALAAAAPLSTARAQATPAAVPAARPADVGSMDGILAALYEVISGPAGERRDWDRMRSLFLPEARLIPTGRTQQGEHRARFLTVNDYITQIGPQLERIGFREHEIARRTEAFGGIAHVFSSYSGTTAEAPDRAQRGINSIQLMNDGKRWWIVNVFWDSERPDNPLPEKYLAPRP